MRLVLVHECGNEAPPPPPSAATGFATSKESSSSLYSQLHRERFEAIMSLTPQALKDWGLFDPIAVPLYESRWREAGFQLVASAIAEAVRAPSKAYGEPEGIDESLLQVNPPEEEEEAKEADEEEEEVPNLEADESGVRMFFEEPSLVRGIDDQPQLRINPALLRRLTRKVKGSSTGPANGTLQKQHSSWKVLAVPVGSRGGRDDHGSGGPHVQKLKQMAVLLETAEGVAAPDKLQFADEGVAHLHGLDSSRLGIDLGSKVLRASRHNRVAAAAGGGGSSHGLLDEERLTITPVIMAPSASPATKLAEAAPEAVAAAVGSRQPGSAAEDGGCSPRTPVVRVAALGRADAVQHAAKLASRRKARLSDATRLPEPRGQTGAQSPRRKVPSDDASLAQIV